MTIANSSFHDNMVGGVGSGGAAVYIASGMATITDSYFQLLITLQGVLVELCM